MASLEEKLDEDKYDKHDKKHHLLVANSSNETAGPSATISNASK